MERSPWDDDDVNDEEEDEDSPDSPEQAPAAQPAAAVPLSPAAAAALTDAFLLDGSSYEARALAHSWRLRESEQREAGAASSRAALGAHRAREPRLCALRRRGPAPRATARRASLILSLASYL